MRKKSHISVAWFLINSEGMELLGCHRGSFYIGSILPDCIPSFLVRRHTFEDSFDILEDEFGKLFRRFDEKGEADRYFCRHLGVITHYMADYFTFPHNANYPGKLRDHCIYEEELKHAIRSYVHSPEAASGRLEETVHSSEAILQFVRRAHEIYCGTQSTVERDCEYIVVLCRIVVDAILVQLESQAAKSYLSESR